MIPQPSSLTRPSVPVNTALIRYPRFNELLEDIQACQQLSALTGEAHCMALDGRTGAGKSTLVKAYTATFPRDETGPTSQVPVFYLETPSPVTVKGMAARMLEAIGDPAAHKGPLWSMNSRLITYLKLCRVQLVILDDFHHLIDQETNRILETVSDWLKVLIKETNVPFLVIGIEGRVEPILQANPQLSRLFAIRETLQPFSWQPTATVTNQPFAAFVQVAEAASPLPFATDLPRAEWLHRLHYATDGVVGHLMNLVRFATWLADHHQTSQLTLDLFRQAFAKRLQPHLAHKVNPFTVAATHHFLPPPRPAPSADR
jgi:hypothetical protein